MVQHAMAEPHACQQRASQLMRRAAVHRTAPDQHKCRREWDHFCVGLTWALRCPLQHSARVPLSCKPVYHILCMPSEHITIQLPRGYNGLYGQE